MTFGLCRKLGLFRELSKLCVVHESSVDSPILNEGINVTKEFGDLFIGTGLLCTGVEQSSSIDKQATPFSQPAQRLPQAIMPKVKAAMGQMVADGVICSIEEPMPFCSVCGLSQKWGCAIREVESMMYKEKSFKFLL